MSELEARVAALEKNEGPRDKKLDDIHQAVVGGHDRPGLGERVRVLEDFRKTVVGAAYAIMIAIGSAWALVSWGPPKPPGH